MQYLSVDEIAKNGIYQNVVYGITALKVVCWVLSLMVRRGIFLKMQKNWNA